MTIEAKVYQTNYCFKIEIVSVTIGFSKYLVDGEWVNITKDPERFEEVVLSLNKCFNSIADAEKFMKTRAFKALLKNAINLV